MLDMIPSAEILIANGMSDYGLWVVLWKSDGLSSCLLDCLIDFLWVVSLFCFWVVCTGAYGIFSGLLSGFLVFLVC